VIRAVHAGAIARASRPWHNGAMVRSLPALLAAASLTASVGLSAEAPPPVPTSMMNKAGVVCVKVTPKGTVADAFVVRSTGDGTADADMIDYVSALRWPAAKGPDPSRGTWQPVPVAMGAVDVPALPDRCAPPPARRW